MTDSLREAYPLDWPETEPRTPAVMRAKSRFDVTLARARDELLAELLKLGAKNIVLSTNLELRRDGLPYAVQKRMDDPGVACFWDIKGVSYAMACDSYVDLRSNIRAIGKTIEALRSIERHGSRSLRDRAFKGFAALPANAGGKSWREVLGFHPATAVTPEAIEARYRELALVRHPDRGGSPEAMAELNKARVEALAPDANRGGR